MTTAMDRLIANLQAHEGFRGLVYDDRNGKPLRQGDTILGNPTIGYGWALNKLPMSKAQALFMLRETVQEVVFDLSHRLPWINELDEVRQGVLFELAYNMGVTGLLGFARTLEAIRRHRFEDAADHLLDSKWARLDVAPTRSADVARRLRTGEWT